MKTAISIPDEVFAQAERAAKRLGLSRSEFFTRAAEAMARQVVAGDVTARINAALKKAESKLAPELSKLQAQALADERW